MIHSLPSDLVTSVLSEWSDLETVTRFDTSLCNRSFRDVLLLNFPTCSTWHCNPMTRESLEYMHIRGMKFNSVSIKRLNGFNDFSLFLNKVEYEGVQHLHLLCCRNTNISDAINKCTKLSSLDVKVKHAVEFDMDDWQLIEPEILKNLLILKCEILDVSDAEDWEDMWNVTFQRCKSLSTLIIISYTCYVFQNSTWNQLFINNNRTLKVLHHWSKQRDTDDKEFALSVNDQREFLHMVLQCNLESFRWFFYFITLSDIFPFFGNNRCEHLDIQTNFHRFFFSGFKLSTSELNIHDEDDDDDEDRGDVVVYEDELLTLFQLPMTGVLRTVLIEGCYFSNRILELLPSGLVRLTIRGLSQATNDGFRNLISRCERLSFLSIWNSRCVDGEQLQEMITWSEKNRLEIVYN